MREGEKLDAAAPEFVPGALSGSPPLFAAMSSAVRVQSARRENLKFGLLDKRTSRVGASLCLF